MKLRFKYLKTKILVICVLFMGVILFIIPEKINILTELEKAVNCNKNQQECVAKIASKLTAQYTLKQIFTVLEENRSNPEINNLCHNITHYLGAIEYKKTKDLAQVFNSCQHACYEGCFHGATEAYFIDKDILLYDLGNDNLKKEISNICGRRHDHGSVDFFSSCLHGLGHAIMFILQNDLPQALKTCDFLPNTHEQIGCYSGVFMENSQAEYNKDHPSKYIDSKDLSFPCSILEEGYLETCYRYQASHVIRRQGILYPDFKLALRFCDSIPKTYHEACINHASGHMTGYPLDAEALKKTCNLILTDEDRGECIKGVASRLLQQNMGDRTDPQKFCGILDGPYQNFCNTYLKR